MTRCTNCEAIEGGTKTIETEDGELVICRVCEMPEETIVNIDEDYGVDR